MALGCPALPWREAGTGSQGRASCLGWEVQKGVGHQLTPLIFYTPCGQRRLFYSVASLWPQQGAKTKKEHQSLRAWGATSQKRCALFSSPVCHLEGLLEDQILTCCLTQIPGASPSHFPSTALKRLKLDPYPPILCILTSLNELKPVLASFYR